ncbi:dimethylarginine dimethylaminohydrolase family protein [Alkaliphilus transvaalensis]|uniref:dimethylarginine dimethylaminohydrolase family protein n=1 Tax=Alkaliphilus transvaalensis TaxID=114628 RepID=UPI0004793785|nr:arginine deiminase family protein [Alkaliphilus transvaalensis]
MKAFIKNEYDPIHFSLVAYPCNIGIFDDSNPFYNNFNKALALQQYNHLLNVLIQEDIKFNFLDLINSPSQVYTRDIGFPIDGLFFISNLTSDDRSLEIRPLIDYSVQNNLDFYIMKEKVEGGDVFVHNQKIFIGTGGRTTQLAVEEINNKLMSEKKDFEIIQVLFDISKIHLDCVFNILDESTCIITNGVFNPIDITKHFKRVIEVPAKEVASLAANIVNLGNNKILCSNENFSNLLIKHDYDVTFIDFSEVIKLKGGLGCCVLPIMRSSKNM